MHTVPWTTVDGEGPVNLFENGEPRGFDFKYRCGERLQEGIQDLETYLAKWKKPGKQLEILLPQFGKPDSYDSCDLDVLMKTNTIYRSSNGITGRGLQLVSQGVDGKTSV